jgi:rare lipoprotein A (peptidoglycan hydrolase)
MKYLIITISILFILFFLFCLFYPIKANLKETPKIDFEAFDRVLYILEQKNANQGHFGAYSVSGIGSWYQYEIGNWSSANHYVCASKDFPRYSYVKIIAENRKESHCQITDYGPEEWTGRVIDMSPKVFSELTDLKLGLIKVKIEKL